MPNATTRPRIFSARRARLLGGRILLSRRPLTQEQPAGNTTAAATTGPARGPRPASSTPTRRCSSAQTARSRASVGRGAIRSALALLPDPGGLSAQRAQVIQLRAAHPAPAHQVDRGDGGAMHGEETLDADTRGDLPHGERLADPAATLGDDHAFERLEPLLVSLADSNHDPDGVSRLESRYVRAQALTGKFCQSLHGPPPSVVRYRKTATILVQRLHFVIPAVIASVRRTRGNPRATHGIASAASQPRNDYSRCFSHKSGRRSRVSRSASASFHAAIS